MSNLSNPEYAEIADDIYLAYVRVLSAADDALLEELIAEYTAPRGSTSPACDGAQPPQLAYGDTARVASLLGKPA